MSGIEVSLKCIRCVRKTTGINIPEVIKETETHFRELVKLLVDLGFYEQGDLEDKLGGDLETLASRIRGINFEDIPELNFLLTKLSREALKSSVKDSLTLLNNKGIYFARISKLSRLYNPKIKETIFSMAQLDIDFFKRINDRHGHAVGDKVLKAFSSLLKEFFSEEELFRYGGEEFIILATGRKEELFTRLDLFKRKLSEFQIEVDDNGTKVSITFSAGISEYRGNGSNNFYQAVDVLTYSAKQNGRDQIKIG